jgi:hypothetical protein
VTQSATYTATFKTQYQLTTSVTGSSGCAGTITPSGTAWYDASTQQAPVTVAVSAAPIGNCVFAGFTGITGTASSINVTMDAPKSIVANFVPAGTIIITTAPAGLTVNVDGTDRVTPYNVLNNVAHVVSVVSSQSGTTGIRYITPSWSDGGAASHTIPALSTATTVTAAYQTQYMLKITSNPTAAGTVSYNPAGTPDPIDTTAAWFAPATSVTLTAAPASGYQFSNYTNSSGATVTSPVSMTGPISLTANFGQFSTLREYIRVNGRIIVIENK